MPDDPLALRVDTALSASVRPEVAVFAEHLSASTGARGVLFYGSNLRSGALDGVLDFYVLTDGPREKGLWPRVSYHEFDQGGTTLRAKVATMRLATFAHAAEGRHLDTTIWARFVQPCALVWASDRNARADLAAAVREAVVTAGRHAAALGPVQGEETEFWRDLFRATYRAELRVEKAGREGQILSFGAEHFDGLLSLAWQAGGIGFESREGKLKPDLTPDSRAAILRHWDMSRRAGKPLNVLRLLRAATTFEGGARYLAWKVKRHTGIAVPLTPFNERHPLISSPVLVSRYLRARSRRRG